MNLAVACSSVIGVMRSKTVRAHAGTSSLSEGKCRYIVAVDTPARSAISSQRVAWTPRSAWSAIAAETMRALVSATALARAPMS